MIKCTCQRPAGQPHEPHCPALAEAWERAFAAICIILRDTSPDAENLAKEGFDAGYLFGTDPQAFQVFCDQEEPM